MRPSVVTEAASVPRTGPRRRAAKHTVNERNTRPEGTTTASLGRIRREFSADVDRMETQTHPPLRYSSQVLMEEELPGVPGPSVKKPLPVASTAPDTIIVDALTCTVAPDTSPSMVTVPENRSKVLQYSVAQEMEPEEETDRSTPSTTSPSSTVTAESTVHVPARVPVEHENAAVAGAAHSKAVASTASTAAPGIARNAGAKL